MEKSTFYTQLEIQIDGDGNKSVVPFCFDDYNDALAKHFTVLSYAAKSTIPYHASFIIRDDGIMTDGRVCDRRVVPTPDANTNILASAITSESEEK